MEKEVQVYHYKSEGDDKLVGTLWLNQSRGRETYTFNYEKNWVKEGYSLAPSLPLSNSAFYFQNQLPPVITDCAPDRWGKILISKSHKSHNPTEMDYLLAVSDYLRQGALRFKVDGSYAKEQSEDSIPKLLDVPSLFSKTQKFLDGSATAREIQELLLPGSSVGGARPKACAIDKDKKIWIAKFPAQNDLYSIERWAGIADDLARQCRLYVTNSIVKEIQGNPIYMSERYDRVGCDRLNYKSALSGLGAQDGDKYSYQDIADIIRKECNKPNKQLHELWKRAAFNVLITNTDDHLRNHGFLRKNGDWIISPCFDLNPAPGSIMNRKLSTSLRPGDFSASLDLIIEEAPVFGLTKDQAIQSLRAMKDPLKNWEQTARKYDAKSKEIQLMSSAFVHKESAILENI